MCRSTSHGVSRTSPRVARAPSQVKSPDQVEPGQWHFPAEAHKTQVPGRDHGRGGDHGPVVPGRRPSPFLVGIASESTTHLFLRGKD